MPSIKPVSALKNYTTIVNEVTYGNRVYFTKNDHGTSALVDMAELAQTAKNKIINRARELQVNHNHLFGISGRTQESIDYWGE